MSEPSSIHTALLEAKRHMSAPSKNRKAVYGRYADLEAILQAVEPPLADQGLVITQHGEFNGEIPVLVTRLTHTEVNESIESVLPLLTKKPNDPQALGSAITYARRYGITALLSVVADDDDDGNTGSGKNADGSKPKPEPKSEGVSDKDVQDAFEVKGGLSGKVVDALITEFERAEFKPAEVVPEIKKLLGRDFGQFSELTEAESRTAAGHARKVKRGDSERLT